MSESNYTTLVAAQATIAIVALLAGRYVLRVSWATAVAGALLFNSVPLPNPFGFKTPIYLHDVVAPLILVAPALRGVRRGGKVLWLGGLAALLWPAIGTALGAVESAGMSDWVEFLVRRLGFVLFFAAGIQGRFKEVNAAGLLNVGLLVWIGMVAMGLLQYAGVVDTDVGYWASGEPSRVSIRESASAMRGFMGLNRGAVGVWGAAMVAYCAASLGAEKARPLLLRYAFYVGILTSFIAILGSGSRTGVIGATAAVLYVLGRSLFEGRRRQLIRIAALALAAVVAGGGAVTYFDLGVPASRFALESRSLETGEQRARIQGRALEYTFTHPQALLLGMGPATERFVREVGWELGVAHAHSEYVDVLWQAGLPGLIMYVSYLLALFFGMRARRGDPLNRVGTAGQAMLLAGAVTGLAVGNIFTWSSRLATFGLLMGFVYGRILLEMRSNMARPTDPLKGDWPRPPGFARRGLGERGTRFEAVRVFPRFGVR